MPNEKELLKRARANGGAIAQRLEDIGCQALIGVIFYEQTLERATDGLILMRDILLDQDEDVIRKADVNKRLVAMGEKPIEDDDLGPSGSCGNDKRVV